MERAILVRHGESEASALGILNGVPGAAVPLTEAGREQARALGERLARERIDLCATSEFLRAIEMADIALAGRDMPRLVLPELNEIGFGWYEGGDLAAYRRWAGVAGPGEPCPGGGESRLHAVERYIRGYRALLARGEETVLVIAHGLAVRYVLDAARGLDPRPLLEGVPYAEPHELSATELESAIDRLDSWTKAPAY